MYQRVKVKDRIRVPPHLFSEDLEGAIEQVIREEYEGGLAKNAGILLLLNKIESVGEGVILPEDGAVYYETLFEMIAWEPHMHEVVEGVISEVREFGVFMRMGPIDGLVHVSQVMDDFVNYSKAGSLLGKQSGTVLKVGDKVRARIIAISLKSKETGKIGLTMRQSGMGRLDLVEQQVAETEADAKKGGTQ
ncbi:DNA-directed RNA polymerase [archaeon CG10_big_fil_rev_8_21_14_0_10_43_11]|nr:MAG: DNA-directed RNA polymerase [archaeon CG10_big_fil_rev_8_21_14_0_10_43_11]